MSESESPVSKPIHGNKIENIIDGSDMNSQNGGEIETSQKISDVKNEVLEEVKQDSEDQFEGKRMVLRNKKKTSYWKDDGDDDDDEDFWKEEEDTNYVSKRRTRQSGNNSSSKSDKYSKRQKYGQSSQETKSTMQSAKKSTRAKKSSKKSSSGDDSVEYMPKKRRRSSGRYREPSSNSELDEKEAAESLVTLADTLLNSIGIAYYPLEYANPQLYHSFLYPPDANNTSTTNTKGDKGDPIKKPIPPFQSLPMAPFSVRYGEHPYTSMTEDFSNQMKWKRCATHVKLAHLIKKKKSMDPYLAMEKQVNVPPPNIPHGSTNFLGKFTMPNNIKESIM